MIQYLKNQPLFLRGRDFHTQCLCEGKMEQSKALRCTISSQFEQQVPTTEDPTVFKSRQKQEIIQLI